MLRMLRPDNDFFVLLRSALWQKACGELSSGPDWDYLYNLAGEQTVLGLISDGISILGLEDTLPEEQSTLFMTAGVKAFKDYSRISTLQASVTTLFKERGLDFRVVKGLQAASLYPKPFLRACGDIDVLLPYSDYLKAREILAPLAGSESGEYEYAAHKGYFFPEGEVELHGCLHPDLGEKADIAIDRACEDLFAGKISDPTFCAFYYFLHCLQHLFLEGVGVRQFSDLALLLSKAGGQIDSERLREYVAIADMGHEWNVVMTFLNTYLGLSVELDGPCLQREADDLWASCKARGNMGFHYEGKISSENFWWRKLQKLRKTADEWFAHRRISTNLAKMMLGRDCRKYFHIKDRQAK